MSLTLDPTLLNVQDNLIRHPIVELISTQPVNAIPFDGEYFNSSNTPEVYPDLLAHSSGRMVSVCIRNTDDLIFLYTDTAKLVWTEVTINLELYLSRHPDGISICELNGGNVGVILTERYGTTYKLQYMILSETGVVISSRTDIGTYSSPNVVTAPFVYMLQDDSFLLVYAHYDGTDYSIFKRTSANFTSWSAASSISPAGFESTYISDHPSLIQVASGDILLSLDHINIKLGDNIVTNIFLLISDDGGVTWGAPDQLTAYTSLGSGGVHPYMVLSDSNIIRLSFHESNTMLLIDYNSPLWENDCASPANSIGASLHYDPDTKKLYVKQLGSTGGFKALCGIVVVDVDTMEVDNNYNTSTVPDYSNLFKDTHVWYGGQKHHSEGKYVAISTMDGANMATVVVNNEAETITTYVFKDNGVYGDISENMEGWDGRTERWEGGARIFGTWVDAVNDRVYLLTACAHIYEPYILVGYIDLTESADAEGKYNFNEISWITSWNERQIYGLLDSSGGILIINELNRFCLYGKTSIASWEAMFGVYDLTSGDCIREYNQSSLVSFPYNGIGNCVYKDNHVYGNINYTTIENQDIYRGLCDIDIVNEIISYHRPTYAAVNDYHLLDAAVMDVDRIAFADRDYGIAIYNSSEDSWYLYNEDNVSGFDPGNLASIAWNAADEVFYVGNVAVQGAGIRAIPETGTFNQGKYIFGTLSVGWDFSSSEDLSIGIKDSDFAIAIDNDGILWSLWVRQDSTYYSIKWDKDQAELDITPYLIDSVSVSWDIQNGSSVNFRLSRGYLFDINNSLSTLYIYVKKGRSIILRFGESVDGVEYWQNQGTFYIKSTKVSYEREKYPSLSVSCEDKFLFLESVGVSVSEYYSEQYPEDIIRDVVPLYTDLELADISIDDFDNRHVIWHQIVDKDLLSSIKSIVDHFGYFVRMDVNNKLVTIKIRTAVDAIDHNYTLNSGVIINFTPDDNYSSFVNEVIVKGELRDMVEVLYAEEIVGSVSGSGGWWESGDVTKTVYFSEDKERKCREVGLNIITSISDFEILWIESSGTEYISYVDPNELYIEITIEFPGLQAVLIGLLAAVIALGVAALWCYLNCGPYIMAFSVLVSAVGYLLGQVATYEYEVYGRPVGEVKQTVQATANDYEFQSYIGISLTGEITDEFCYSVLSCQEVADYELEIIKAQRKRVSFSKVAHLQDEIGDIIQIHHPYSEQPLDIFITSLKRRFTPGKSGSFIDSIEGWNL